MKNHSELMSRVLENSRAEQEDLRRILHSESSEVLKSFSGSLKRALNSTESDISRRLQKFRADLMELEQLTSRWLWAHAMNAAILITLMIISLLLSNLIRQQWGLWEFQMQLGGAIKSMIVDQERVWVPVERNVYHVDQSGQLYMMISTAKEN